MKRTTLLAAVKIFARKNPLGTFGFTCVILMVFAALFADVVTIYELVAISLANMLVSPNANFFLRADQFGRDIFFRIVYGV